MTKGGHFSQVFYDESRTNRHCHFPASWGDPTPPAVQTWMNTESPVSCGSPDTVSKQPVRVLPFPQHRGKVIPCCVELMTNLSPWSRGQSTAQKTQLVQSIALELQSQGNCPRDPDFQLFLSSEPTAELFPHLLCSSTCSSVFYSGAAPTDALEKPLQALTCGVL